MVPVVGGTSECIILYAMNITVVSGLAICYSLRCILPTDNGLHARCSEDHLFDEGRISFDRVLTVSSHRHGCTLSKGRRLDYGSDISCK